MSNQEFFQPSGFSFATCSSFHSPFPLLFGLKKKKKKERNSFLTSSMSLSKCWTLTSLNGSVFTGDSRLSRWFQEASAPFCLLCHYDDNLNRVTGHRRPCCASAKEQRTGLGPRRGAVGTVDGWEEVEMRLQSPPRDRGRWLFVDSSLQVIYTRNVLLEERMLSVSEQRISVGKEQVVVREFTPKISNLSLL